MARMITTEGGRVRIDHGRIDAEFTKLRDVAPEDYRSLMHKRRAFAHDTIAHDCRCLLEFVEDAEKMYQPLGFRDANDFIARGLELDPTKVRWALDGVRQLRPDLPIPFQKAIELGQREIGIAGGKAGPGRGNKTSVIGVRLSKSPNSRAYLIARLRRDGFAELADQVEAKEISARAAAIEAGFSKNLSAFDKIVKLLPKLTDDERNRLRDMLNK
jgi:hypothetical protein